MIIAFIYVAKSVKLTFINVVFTFINVVLTFIDVVLTFIKCSVDIE